MRKQNQIIRIEYLIDEEEKTADVIEIKASIEQIFIPRSIIKIIKEYYITNILKNAFNSSKIKYIQFSLDSKYQTIEKKMHFQNQKLRAS